MIYQTFWNGPLAGQAFKIARDRLTTIERIYRVMYDNDLDVVTRNSPPGSVWTGWATYRRIRGRWICQREDPATQEVNQ